MAVTGQCRQLRGLPRRELQARGPPQNRQGSVVHAQRARQLQWRLPRLQRFEAINDYQELARTVPPDLGCEVQALSSYGTSSEYVRELIRKDQDRERVRGLLLKGAASPATTLADKAYFRKLRTRVRRAPKAAGRS